MQLIPIFRVVRKKSYWSCHGITRTIQRYLKLSWIVYDGWFIDKGFEHSWLYLSYDPKGSKRFVMDPYPFAAVHGPLLVDFSVMSPWRNAYIERGMNYAPLEIEHFENQTNQIFNMYNAKHEKISST
jgi:hypothetical protein